MRIHISTQPGRPYDLLFRLLSIIVGVITLSGFSFSDPHKFTQELKKEIRLELQKIAEKTPSAKLRNEWRQRRDQAISSLEKAEATQASKYCPEKWDQAVALFKKAKYYAAKRSYRKAIFLAKKANDMARQAFITSKAMILKQETRLNKQYRKLRSRADELTGSIPMDAEELSKKAADISLTIEDARLATELLQFDQAQRELSSAKKALDNLEKLIHRYKKEHPAPDADEET